nr:DEAD/DEAH box helicase [Arcobacter sp.]
MEFEKLNLDKDFNKNLKSLGFEYMTSIQQKALPFILDKKDVIAKANTGSGKTLAFCLPIIRALRVEDFKIQALILAPTRELANQIANELRALA